MAHLVEDITKHFQFEDVDIDCWTFKLYSKGCVILFFAGSMVGVMSQYFGEPIQCDFKVKMQMPNSWSNLQMVLQNCVIILLWSVQGLQRRHPT